MAMEDKGAKALVGAGALFFVLAQSGGLSGVLVQDNVVAGMIVVGAFLALLTSDRGQ